MLLLVLIYNGICLHWGLRIPPWKRLMIWLTEYDESRAIRDVKRGQASPSRNTYTFQTVFDSHFQFLRYVQCLKVCFFRFSLAHLNGRNPATQEII